MTHLSPAICGSLSEETGIEIRQELPSLCGKPLLNLLCQVKFQRTIISQENEVQHLIIPVVDHIHNAGTVSPLGTELMVFCLCVQTPSGKRFPNLPLNILRKSAPPEGRALDGLAA